jgi:hypothetical protein
MGLSIDEDAINEMVGDQNAPVNVQMQRLRAWCAEALRTTDESGKPNADIIYKQGNYNMGENSIHIAMLALKNKLRLNALNKEYSIKKREVYVKMYTTKLKWVPSKDGENIMVEGDPDLAEMRERIKCQEDFVKFLEQMQDLMRYYPRNAASMTEVHNFGQEIGQIIVGVKKDRPYGG